MDLPADPDLDLDPDLLARLTRPGPRYTSYPTANVLTGAFGPADHAAALARLGASGRRASLYVHLPFCRQLCHYCACNVVITRRRGAAAEFLDALERELDLVAAALGRRLGVAALHLGGGTPTYLTPAELTRLHGALAARFDLSGADELAVEVDPRVTTREHLDALAGLGWRRLSVGVQDFDPTVQQAVRRLQSVEQTRAAIDGARAAGFTGVNVDLIYGLPFQTAETFARSLEEVVGLAPDRVALFSYAHVPWLRPAQASFDRRGFPRAGPLEKLGLLRQGVARLEAAGLVHLGMDHFARPGDALARAHARGELHRDFQGYGVRHATDLIGLGPTAISDVDGCYAQGEKELPAWRAALEAGRLPTARGWRLDEDDRRRRTVIMDVMCGRGLALDVEAAFPDAAPALEAAVRDGLLRREGAGLAVTRRGRFFLRNIAMAFDAHLPAGDARPRFSQTV